MSEITKRRLLIIILATSLLPCLLLLRFPELVTPHSVGLWGSAVLGYMGIVLLLWMYILGAKAVMGKVFYDLAPVLRIHKALGKYGTLLIFAHPLLVTYSYGEQLFYSVIPNISTQASRHILLGQIAIWLLAIVWVTSALIRKRLSWRAWRYLHWLAYIAIPFALLHVPDLGSQTQAHRIVKGYLFLLMLTFAVVSAVRLLSIFNIDRTRYRIKTVVQLTSLDTLLTLMPAANGRLKPRLGQYVYIKLGMLSEDHPFSVVHSDQNTGEIWLAFRHAGMYTQQLEQLGVGQTVYLSGPYGSFTSSLADTDTAPVVYIAGGIGITPFVDRILMDAGAREQWLFDANRTRELAVLYQPLKEMLGDRAIAIYNQPSDTLQPGEEPGVISAEILSRYLIDPTRYRYFICGPPPMMTAVSQLLQSLEVPKKNIEIEKFGW
ncbi:MAG: ferric reductase-like transmembrane domain-containing protein [Candidatus Saccharimonas sp.]